MFEQGCKTVVVAAWLLLGGAAAAQDAVPARPDGAGVGYRVATLEGCGVWLASGQPPAETLEISWSGACKDGWADGLGMQVLTVGRETVQTLTGYLRQGRWQGLGRMHLYSEDGLVAIHEGLFKDDRMEGLFVSLLAVKNPLNERYAAYVQAHKAGLARGKNYLQVRQFFKLGDSEMLCNSPVDCTDQALEQGKVLPLPDLTDPLSATLPLGGWRWTVSGYNTDSDGFRLPVSSSGKDVCWEAERIKPGQENRHSAFLFPQVAAWRRYQDADYFCEDEKLTLDGLSMAWDSVCTSPDESQMVRIHDVRRITDQGVELDVNVVAYKGQERLRDSVRHMRWQHLGACTEFMERAGQIGF